MFEKSLWNCNFAKRLENCDKSNFSVKKDNYESEFNLDNDTDLVFLFKWLQFILIIILQPILSFFCIIFNLLNIKIIKIKHLKKSFTSIMYKHIVINSYFNIIYCVIINFVLINQCIFINSIFCSSFYYTEWAQYFKIIVSVYLASVIKFCKNVSFLVFTLSRFSTRLDKKNPFQIKLKSMNLKIYLAVLVITSALINFFKLFQYKIVSKVDQTRDFPSEKFNEKVCNLDNNIYCQFFNTMKLIVLLINNFSIYIINFLVDVSLLKGVSDFIRKKKELAIKIKNTEDDIKMKTARMVMISNIFYLLAYMPEIVVSLLVITYSNNLYKFPNFNLSSTLIIEEFETIELLSIVFNFYILIYFNYNFYIGFQHLKDKAFFALLKLLKRQKISNKI